MMFEPKDVSKWSSSDRFIPRRSTRSFEYSYYLINNSNTEEREDKNLETCDIGVILSAKHQYNRQNYISHIRNVLLPKKGKVLEFSNKRSEMSYETQEPTKISWPVIARTKPLLGPPSVVLDMPNLDTHYCRQVVDWGKKGYLAAIHEGEVYLWHPRKVLHKHVTKTNASIGNCIKWNVDGTLLACSRKRSSSVIIWDFQVFKGVGAIECRCRCCNITSMTWTRSNCLLTGCSNGVLSCWSSNLKCISSSKLHTGDIISLKLSCAENNLLTSGIDGVVNVILWPLVKPIFVTRYRGPVKALDWHPWRNSLLAVGQDASFTIYNVNTQNPIDSKQITSYSISDCLSFNPLSGELLISQFTPSVSNDESLTKLSVLKNLDCVVDEIQYRFGRYAYLLWDSTGTKLATASSDENLCIWDFFGSANGMEKKYLKRNTKFLTTNMFETLGMFGKTLR